MKLNLQSPCFGISESVLQETGTMDFLLRMSPEFPILSCLTLPHLSPEQQKIHWQETNQIIKNNSSTELNLAWNLLKSIPMPESAILGLESSQIGLSELTLLAQFVSGCLKLGEIKSLQFPLAPAREIQKALQPYLNESNSRLVESPEIRETMYKLNLLQDKKNAFIQNWEQLIQDTTSIIMSWPLPREFPDAKTFPLDSDTAKSLSLIQTPRNNASGYMLYFSTPENLQKLEQQQKDLTSEIQSLTETQMNQAMITLSPLTAKIRQFFHSVQTTAWKIHLAFKTKELKLCIPEVSNHLHIEEGRLTRLSEHSLNYQPLNFLAEHSVSLIFGSNMSGKTTVLKTILHLCLLALHGLPTPCKKFILPRISSVRLHLKDSGSVEKGLSSFASEMQFFAKPDADCLLLADEIFQSTEPVSGSKIASLLLQDYRDHSYRLIATTHYSEPIGIPKINHFSMSQDFEAQPLCDQNVSQLLLAQRQDTLKLAISLLPKDSSLVQKLNALLNDGKKN